MKKCFACGNEQETGKFCGKCGGAIEEHVEGNLESRVEVPNANNAAVGLHPQQVVSATPSEHVEKVKEHSKMFWNYFLRYIKKPSESFVTGTADFINAIISLVAFAIIFGITMYVSISSFIKAAIGGLGELGELLGVELETPPFFSIFGSAFIFTIISMALVVLALFTVAKFFGPTRSWKELLSYYGAYMLLSSLVGLIGLLLLLLTSNFLGSLIVLISFFIMLVVIPTFIINKLLELKSEKVDKFHGYLIYILLFSFVYWIYMKIVADSTITPIIEQLRNW